MSTKTPGPKRTFLPPSRTRISQCLTHTHTILFMPLLLCFYYKSLSHSWSGHTHPYTQTRTNSMHITLHYPSVGWLGALSGQREWVVTLHYCYITSSVSSATRCPPTTKATQPCYIIPAAATQRSRCFMYIYIYLLKSPSSLSPPCSTAVQSLGGIWCSQWGCCWTMEKQLWQGSGRCEVFSS